MRVAGIELATCAMVLWHHTQLPSAEVCLSLRLHFVCGPGWQS
jgi:hypothetical protein